MAAAVAAVKKKREAAAAAAAAAAQGQQVGENIVASEAGNLKKETIKRKSVLAPGKAANIDMGTPVVANLDESSSEHRTQTAYSSGSHDFVGHGGNQEQSRVLSESPTPRKRKKRDKQKRKSVVQSAASIGTRIRRKAKKFYTHSSVEIFVALLIVGNFFVNAAEAQIPGQSPDVFKIIEVFFTVVFTVELLVNMTANWWMPFWASGWNIFDFVVVVISLMSLMLESLPGVNMLRLLRAFRVVRLFKRAVSLRKILNAIYESVPGVSNAFSILMLVMMLYAILAVDFFSIHQEYFGNFAKALFTMFQMMTAEGWADIARELMDEMEAENKSHPQLAKFLAAMFFVSYIMICNIILANVVIAVLIEQVCADQAEPEEETSALSDASSDDFTDDELLTNEHTLALLPPPEQPGQAADVKTVNDVSLEEALDTCLSEKTPDDPRCNDMKAELIPGAVSSYDDTEQSAEEVPKLERRESRARALINSVKSGFSGKKKEGDKNVAWEVSDRWKKGTAATIATQLGNSGPAKKKGGFGNKKSPKVGSKTDTMLEQVLNEIGQLRSEVKATNRRINSLLEREQRGMKAVPGDEISVNSPGNMEVTDYGE
ncbi:hypothetical protein CYMTET_30022 [Cymbomonas tetramitiformis]|uniref:Ion transport domain-containing protein n=1 Tax=Cymbomonas tetramitiformis TaxID=36881 RepID=A0AAE0FJN7_9CHLO|nr:hypothetical protein CYMTET_30022 [Cymbomonas tetramitiformis]